MSWKRPVSVVVVAILVGLPVSGALCAVLCDEAGGRAARTAGHHGSATDCPEHAAFFAGPQVSSPSQRDCGNPDARLQQVSGPVTERADWGVVSHWVTTTAQRTPATVLHASSQDAEDAAPPGTSPPTTAPLALRI